MMTPQSLKSLKSPIRHLHHTALFSAFPHFPPITKAARARERDGGSVTSDTSTTNDRQTRRAA